MTIKNRDELILQLCMMYDKLTAEYIKKESDVDVSDKELKNLDHDIDTIDAAIKELESIQEALKIIERR